MRIFIWEGDGISNGYHDDGTLVVLAETEEQARELAIATGPAWDDEEHWWVDGQHPDVGPATWVDCNRDGYAGSPKPRVAIERPADRVVDLDAATVVAFNGGGYD